MANYSTLFTVNIESTTGSESEMWLTVARYQTYCWRSRHDIQLASRRSLAPAQLVINRWVAVAQTYIHCHQVMGVEQFTKRTAWWGHGVQ